MDGLAKFAQAKAFSIIPLALGLLSFANDVSAETVVKRIPTQYIAALGDKDLKSGIGAETWGLWPVDPGPRGVQLSNFKNLEQNNGGAPANWKFDHATWWLEEHGLIMERPVFPIVPGKYIVTGGRDATAVLTIEPKGNDGQQHWQLNNGATLYDVTHLGCRAANYTPATTNSCTPAQAAQENFPVQPGAAMPPVGGCNKQDYQVLIVLGTVVEE